MNDTKPPMREVGSAPADPLPPARPCLLVVAGNDPSGGAGVTADTQTATALGLHPLPVLTAVTAQSTRDATSVHALSAAQVREQLEVLLADVAPAAIKVGLLPSTAVVETVAEVLAQWRHLPLVVDPVLKAGGGGRLADDAVGRSLVERLLPLATVITPNRFELTQLLAAAGEADADGDVAAGARRLAERCGCDVLVTGADVAADEGLAEVTNLAVLTSGARREWRWSRLPARYHGSGCTLAAALACQLPWDREMLAAMTFAQRFTYGALRRAFRPGTGQYVPLRVLD